MGSLLGDLKLCVPQYGSSGHLRYCFGFGWGQKLSAKLCKLGCFGAGGATMLGSPLKKAFRLRLKLTWLPATTRPNLVGKDKEGNKMKWLRRLTGMTRQMGFKEKCGLGLKLKGKKKVEKHGKRKNKNGKNSNSNLNYFAPQPKVYASPQTGITYRDDSVFSEFKGAGGKEKKEEKLTHFL